MLDPIRNHAMVTVSAGYAIGATSIVLASGHGSKLPDPSTEGAFNLVWWNSTDYKNPSLDPYVEIVRVTGRTSDTLTVVRPAVGNDYNGEGSINVASAKNIVGRQYRMILAPTKKTIDDIDDYLDAISNSRVYGCVPTGDKNGVNQVYTLPETPKTGSVAVFLNGMRQAESIDYTIAGDEITMSYALESTETLIVDYDKVI